MGLNHEKCLSIAMLFAPFLFAVTLLLAIQTMDEPVIPANPNAQITSSPENMSSTMKDRVSIMVILEVFAFSLIVRPWEFPWETTRFVIAEVLFMLWGALVIPMAMHGGRLLAIHALGLMGLLAFVLPVCILTLFIRRCRTE